MFDGEQLHPFIASSNNLSLISSSLHHNHHQNVSSSLSFDPFITTTTTTTSNSPQFLIHHHQQHQPISFLHTFNQPHKRIFDQQESDNHVESDENNGLIDVERSKNESSWSDDEVLALLSIRSSLDNWFPDWEHVSRKLGEVGYKRSAEKCKEKFEEEESRYLSNINCNKSNRLQFNEFGDGNKLEKPRVVEEEGIGREEQDKDFLEGLNNVEKETTTKDKDQSVVDPLEDVRRKEKSKRKRKRGRDEEDGRFEALKGYCEEIVKKMMMQQEEMHLKLIEDMVKRDEEKIAIEEAWKKQEFDRVNKELEVRAHEQAIASDRQSTLIKFLISFTSSSTSRSSNGNWNHLFDDIISRSSIKVPTTSPPPLIQNHEIQNPSSNLNNPKPQQNPNSPKKHTPLSPNSISSKDKDDIGKRWPRDEVFALINLRCNIQNPNHHHQDKEEGQSRIPLWERISQGMLELGYKRSAKRCKEKWENINKYFRKTKDVNKKRSLDSRTCPYFHQLNTLYNQGTLLSSSPPPPLPLSSTTLPENQPGSSQAGSSSDSTLHQQQGDKILVQVPTFDFEH